MKMVPLPVGACEFIADDGGKDVFVHVTSVVDPSVEIFREDRRVRYVERVSQRSGNPEAFDVL